MSSAIMTLAVNDTPSADANTLVALQTTQPTDVFDDVTQVLNASSTPASRLYPASVNPLQLAYIVFGSVGFGGNIFVALVSLVSSRMRKGTANKLVINQSIVDMLACLFVLLVGLLPTTLRPSTVLQADSLADQVLCRLWVVQPMQWGMVIASNYNIVAITIERYLAVVHPFVHKVKLGGPLIYAFIAVPWAIGLTFIFSTNVALTGIVNGTCKPFSVLSTQLMSRAVGVLSFCVEYLFPLGVMIVCYIHMLKVLATKVSSNVASSRNAIKFTTATAHPESSASSSAPTVVMTSSRVNGSSMKQPLKLFAIHETTKILKSADGDSLTVFKSHSTPPSTDFNSVADPVSIVALDAKAHSPATLVVVNPVVTLNQNSRSDGISHRSESNLSQKSILSRASAANNNLLRSALASKGEVAAAQPPVSARQRARHNVLKTLLLVCAALFLCHSWNQIWFLVYFLGGTTDVNSAFYRFTVVAEFTNCCINPFIYTAKYRDFQAAIRGLVGWVIDRKRVGSADIQPSQTGTQY